MAGGAGQRLWPLSRRNSPKQFTPLVGAKSSIQLAVERLQRLVDPGKIFVGTNAAYADLLRTQLPSLPERNYILEPSRQDVAAAVALAFFALEKDGVKGPVVFQWSDHYVKHDDTLLGLFEAGKELVEKGKAGMVIVAQEPTFANDNLGWIKLEGSKGAARGEPFYAFGEWVYRPSLDRCQQMFQDKQWVWNTGHFVTSVEFMTSSFRSRAPGLAAAIEKIVSFQRDRRRDRQASRALPAHRAEQLRRRHPQADSPRQGLPAQSGFGGGRNPGNLNSLKEFLQAAADDTVTRGNVVNLKTTNSFLYNGTDCPLVVMGMSNVIVVELPDGHAVIATGPPSAISACSSRSSSVADCRRFSDYEMPRVIGAPVAPPSDFQSNAAAGRRLAAARVGGLVTARRDHAVR